jgi:hypothetical protein
MIGEFDLASTDRLLTTTRSVRRRHDFARPVPLDLMKECMQIALQANPAGVEALRIGAKRCHERRFASSRCRPGSDSASGQ